MLGEATNIVGPRRENCAIRKPIPAPTREEFLSYLYIDYLEEPWKHGSELEEALADIAAELRELGEWERFQSYLTELEEKARKMEEERANEAAKAAEKAALREEKEREHKLKVAAMEEAARKELAEVKARAAAALAARQVVATKNGQACKYFRNNGMPEPASEGYNEGCDYHKLGKCPFVHPDEAGWSEAVAKRTANHKTHHHHHHAPRGAGGGNWRGSSRSESWRR